MSFGKAASTPAQVTCFVVHAVPLAGTMFLARERPAFDDLLLATGRNADAVSQHSEILALSTSGRAPAGEAFPTLTELLKAFASALREAGQLRADMPLARAQRNIAQARVCHHTCGNLLAETCPWCVRARGAPWRRAGVASCLWSSHHSQLAKQDDALSSPCMHSV